MPNKNLDFMHPFFMGAYAENDHIFENLLLEFVRDHAYWRRNFHPENRPPIPRTARYRDDYNEFMAAMQQELSNLSSDLKKSVPFFSPRYIGHMAADLLMPGVLAQVMTTLYNPNNVSDDAAPATLEKELDVGIMLAEMFGFSTDPKETPCAWGHLTSGGTVANYESLWNFRAVKFYPLAMREAAKKIGFDVDHVGPKCQKLSLYSDWELVNFSIREAAELMRRGINGYKESVDRSDPDYKIKIEEFNRSIVSETPEYLGMAGFFRKHSDLNMPRILVPVTGHYSWQKGAKILGFGEEQIMSVANDGHMRMRADHLEECLAECMEKEIPVLCVVGILGTTEFGSVDPIHEIVRLRDEWQKKNCFFGIHVDAAWGGYMTTIFRNGDGEFGSHEDISKKFKYFPHKGTWEAFRAVSKTDSVTIDPHKLGYLPFQCGAFVSRDAGVLDFICQKAAYVFDLKEDPFRKSPRQKLMGLGQYIMEGSKAGSAAAAAYVAHKVLPLHNEGFGKILVQSMRSCEYFFDKLHELSERLSDKFVVTIPFPPDTNLICYCINPKRNRYLALMNHFSRKVFGRMRINKDLPLQAHDFFGSFTSLVKGNLEESEAERIMGLLGVDPQYYVKHVGNRQKEADHIYMIRHTLMNPWLMHEDESGLNYIDHYCNFLANAIEEEWRQAIEKGGNR